MWIMVHTLYMLPILEGMATNSDQENSMQAAKDKVYPNMPRLHKQVNSTGRVRIAIGLIAWDSRFLLGSVFVSHRNGRR